MPSRSGKVERAGRDDLAEGGVLPGVAVEQADVVGRGAHAGTVQTRRRGRPGVASAELGRQSIELLHRGRHAAQLHGQCVRRIVAGVHEQPMEQLVDGVGAAGSDADLGALRGRVLGGARHGLVQVQLIDGGHRDEHLDDAGRTVPAVRIPGGDDIAGVEVGDQPRLGGDVIGQRRRAGRGHHAATGERTATERFGGHRQRQRRITDRRDFRRVDRRRRRHPVRTAAGVRRGAGFGACNRGSHHRGHTHHRRRRGRAQQAPGRCTQK